MQDWLIQHLACPDCSSDLKYVAYPGEEGILRCSTCGEFPVINGIPRLLPSQLLKVYLQEYYPGHAHRIERKHDVRTLAPEEFIQLKTMFSFGYQWNHFDDNHDAWQQEYQRCMCDV